MYLVLFPFMVLVGFTETDEKLAAVVMATVFESFK